MAPFSPHGLLLVSGAVCLLAATAHDVVARTIPHWAVLGVAAIGVLLRLDDGLLPQALLAACAVLTIAVALWALRLIGGGDAKLFGAVALLVPPVCVIPVVCSTAVLGAVLALPYIAFRGRLGRAAPGGRSASLAARTFRAERFRLNRGGPLPYGLAIALGALSNLWSVGA